MIFLALGLTGLVFLTESWTPLGFAHGLLYLVPLILLRHEPLALQAGMAVLVTIMIVIGYLASPPGFREDYVLLNRALSVLAAWAMVIIQADGRAAALVNSPPGRGPASKARGERV
ncbi:hypothetical protein ACFPB0_11360 [Glycocaulis abyssi]|uniref:DUF2069 domain-containing protein n=2 Tax=Glycocaulis abyssi TaxID=1433403 RepID=A0ABV9NDH9_9PROT